MTRHSRSKLVVVIALLGLLAAVALPKLVDLSNSARTAAPMASAQILGGADQSGTVTINEDDGFPGVCDQPCYIVEMAFEVFLAGNPNAPGVCGAGEVTYLYTITHQGGTGTPLGFIPAITQFGIDVTDATLVSAAGFIPGPDIDPSGTLIDLAFDVVKWQFFAPPISTGGMSDPLFLCSSLLPGLVSDNRVSVTGQASLDAPGTCVGPFEPPIACEIEVEKTCCIPPRTSPGVDECDGKVTSLKLEYLNADCSATTNDQSGKAKCSGGAPGATIDVVIKEGGKKKASMKKGSKKKASKKKGSKKKGANNVSVSPDTDIPFEGLFTVTGAKLKASTKLELTGADDTQSITIHTSCSKAISCGDQFGSLRIVELTSSHGGTFNCEDSDPDDQGWSMCEVASSGVGTSCTGHPVEVVFEYTGEDCQNPLSQAKAECSGDAMDAEPVSIAYVGKDPGKIIASPSSGTLVGNQVRVTAVGTDRLKASTKLQISDSGGVVQSITVHTSCSQPLSLGDEFGALTLVEMTMEDGEVLSLAQPHDEIFLSACEVPASPPEPHCTSKIVDLGLRYIGGDCTVTNGQEGKATCTGVSDPGSPVSITITEKPGEVSAVPATNIELGDLVSISRDPELKASTEFDVTGPNGTQSIEIHTSCSKQLNLGDRFGSFEVFSMDRKDDGFIGLGGVVEYQYTVTNPNPDQATNVFLDDDVFGEVAGPISLDAGESQIFFVTQTITENTTNTVTASGEVSGETCFDAQATVDVTVPDPIPSPFDCRDAKPIDELSMEWGGSEDICVVAYDGALGGTALSIHDNVATGDVVTVSGMGGSPNDQKWEIFAAGDCGGSSLGTSVFHISCSDKDMNGTEDCGKNLGNGKKDDLSQINDWLFEGISGDSTLDCTP